MTADVDELVIRITSLDDDSQRALLDRVVRFNFEKGLEGLAEAYRRRLDAEGELDKTSDQILAELRDIRDRIAASDVDG